MNGNAVSIDAGAVVYGVSHSGEIAERIPSAENDIRYYHQDHLASSNIFSDAKGNILGRELRYPFGYLRARFGNFEVKMEYGFTQKEEDFESLLCYFEARLLSSLHSRFLSVDPLFDLKTMEKINKVIQEKNYVYDNPQSLNVYAYVQGNPVNLYDPTGMLSISKAKEYALKGYNAERESTGQKAGILGSAIGGLVGFFEIGNAMETIDRAYTKSISEEQVILEETQKLDEKFEEMNDNFDVDVGKNALLKSIDRFVEKISDGKYNSVTDLTDGFDDVLKSEDLDN
jgi:RHS repeat-associated protein